MSLLVALKSATIFVNIVDTSAIWDSFIFNFLVGILTVMVTIPKAYIFSKFPPALGSCLLQLGIRI